MKLFNEILNEQNSLEIDTTTVDDDEISSYLGSNKILIVSDERKSLKGSFKVSKKITSDKILGTLNGIKTVFINLKFNKDNHFYYFNQKDKSKVEKLVSK